MPIEIPAPIIGTKVSPREVLAACFKSIPELPISGGWGYTQEEAVIIDKNDPIVLRGLPFDGIGIEHIFIEKRVYVELIVARPTDDRFGSITWDPILQELKKISGKRYDVLTFDVAALHDKDSEALNAEYEGPNGCKSPEFNKDAFFAKWHERNIHYVAEYWFDITSFFGQ